MGHYPDQWSWKVNAYWKTSKARCLEKSFAWLGPVSKLIGRDFVTWKKNDRAMFLQDGLEGIHPTRDEWWLQPKNKQQKRNNSLEKPWGGYGTITTLIKSKYVYSFFLFNCLHRPVTGQCPLLIFSANLRAVLCAVSTT